MARPNALRSCSALLLVVACVGNSWAADSIKGPSEQLRIFSSIAFNRDAGDYYGLELTFVPYTGGTYVLWRMASGRIQTPRLLEATPKGRGWVLQLPADDDVPGEWVIEQSGQELSAKAPTGTVFRLKRRQ